MLIFIIIIYSRKIIRSYLVLIQYLLSSIFQSNNNCGFNFNVKRKTKFDY